MPKLSFLRMCIILSALLAGSFLLAKSGMGQNAPAPSTSVKPSTWAVKRPFIRFYTDVTTWPRENPKGTPPIVNTLGGDFSFNTRVQSTFSKRPDAPSKLPSLSARLLGIETGVEKKYVPYFESQGLPEPLYGEYIQNASKMDKRWVIYWQPSLSGAVAEFKGNDCSPEEEKALRRSVSPVLYRGIGYNDAYLPKTANPPVEQYVRYVLAHELLHASQTECNMPHWREESLPDGYALQAAWLNDISEEMTKSLVKINLEGDLYGQREYYLPLDNDRLSIALWVRGKSRQIAKKSNTDLTDTRSYRTSSYIRYLLDSKSSQPFAHYMFTTGFGGMQTVLKQRRHNFYNQVKKYLSIEAPQHFAAFFTEYASYGYGRYTSFKDLNTEVDIRDDWLKKTFNCSDATTLNLTEKKTGTRDVIELKQVMGLSGQCIKVKWSGLESASVPLRLKLLTKTPQEAEALWLGQAYVSGVTHGKTPNNQAYCYQNLVKKTGGYGAPVINDRAISTPTNQCLFRPVARQKNYKYNEKMYTAMDFTTKFKIGKKTGEAIFILTNAAPYKEDLANFSPGKNIDVVVMAEYNRHKVKWRKRAHNQLDTAGAGPADIAMILANNSDVYFDGIRGSRDIKMGGDIDMSAGVEDLAEEGVVTTLTGDRFIANIIDSENQVVVMMASKNGEAMTIGTGDDNPYDHCGIKADIQVNQRTDHGYDLTYEADLISLPKLIQSGMGGDIDCAAVKAAVYDRVVLESFFPDGRRHIYGNTLTYEFPDNYDQHVDAALNKVGIADLGGLPLKSDLSTFMDGFSGPTMIGGGRGSFPGIDGDDSTNPDEDGGAGNKVDVQSNLCESEKLKELLTEMDALASSCDCTCDLVENMSSDFQRVMTESVMLGIENNACMDILSAKSAAANERLDKCLMQKCLPVLSTCR